MLSDLLTRWLLCAVALTAVSQVPGLAAETTQRQQRLAEWTTLKQAAYESWTNGDLPSAIRHNQRLLQVETELFGADAERLSVHHQQLAICFMETGQLDEARDHTAAAVRILNQHSSADDWRSAAARSLQQRLQVVAELSDAERLQLFDLERHLNQSLTASRYDEALPVAEQLAQKSVELFGDRHHAWVDAMVQVVFVQIVLGQLETASAQLARLQAALEQFAHPRHPDFAVVQWLMAHHARTAGDQARSAEHSLQAMRQFERAAVLFHPLYAQSLTQYAFALLAQGRPQEAVEPLRKAYQLSQQASLSGSQQDEVVCYQMCLTLQTLAAQQFSQQQPAEAERLAQEALTAAAARWGQDYHLTVDLRHDSQLYRTGQAWADADFAKYQELQSLLTQSYALEQQGRYGDCVYAADRAASGLQKLLGNHSRTALLARRRLLILEMTRGSLEVKTPARLKQELLDFVETLDQVLGRQHPDYAEMCRQVAQFLSSGDADSQRLARLAVEAYKASLTVNSDAYVEALTELGIMLASQEDPQTAEILQEALRLWQTRPSAGSHSHGLAAWWLGQYLYWTGDPYAARLQLAEAVRLLRQARPEGIHLAFALNDLANVYSDHLAHTEALVHYRESLQLFQPHLAEVATEPGPGPDADSIESRYRWLLRNTARSLYETQDYAAAEKLLQDLLQRIPAGANSSAEVFRDACYHLSRVLQKLNQPQQADLVLSQARHAVQLHFADQPDAAEIRAVLAVEEARLAISRGQNEQALQFLNTAFAEYRSTAADPATMPLSDLEALTLDLDELLRFYEQIGAWQESVSVRQFLVPLCERTLDAWPDLLLLERQLLQIAVKVAGAEPEQQQQFTALRQLTRQLEQQAEQPQAGGSDCDPATAESLLQVCDSIFAGPNLPAAEFREQLAACRQSQQQYQDALQLQEQAAGTYTWVLGSEHARTTQAQIRIAALRRQTGDYELSRQILQRARQLCREYSGEYALDTIRADLELAKLHLDTRSYASAWSLAESAAQRWGDAWGRHNLTYADAVQVTGLASLGLGERQRATESLRQSHELFQQLLPPTDQRVLQSAALRVIPLAADPRRQAEADQQYQNVIAGYRQTEQTQLPEFAEVLFSYGEALLNWNQTQAAAATLRQALQAVPDLDGHRDDALRAAIQARLGVTQRRLGQLDKAAAQLTQAATTQRRIFGNDSSTLSDTLHQLALAEYLTGRHSQAQRLLLESLQIQQQTLSEIGGLISETALTELLTSQESRLDLLLHILLPQADDPQLAATALTWTIRRKGLALDLRCRAKALQQSRLYDSDVVLLAERIRVLNQQLADLALQAPSEASDADLESQRQQLRTQLSQLNSQLNLALQESAAAPAAAADDSEAVLQSLAADTVFVEFLKVARPGRSAADPKAADPNSPDRDSPDPEADSRYLAFVLNRFQAPHVQLFDLGPAAEIDALISELRETTRRVPRMLNISSEAALEETYRPLAKQLYDKLLGPAAAVLTDARALIVGPDAGLSLVPFAALVGVDDRYLIQQLEISYVSSARDLLRRHAEPGRGTVIISDPNFDADAGLIQESVEDLTGANRGVWLATRGANPSETVELRSLRWRRLPGAEQEAQDVQQLLASSQFQPVTSYLGNQAVEEALKQTRSARILHLATHGFYVPAVDPDSDSAFSGRARTSSGLSRLRQDENPLLRSGLVLAGANRMNQHKATRASETPLEDGWVTAQEIAGLDFRHTELVVLSACESGLGDVSSGQGVQGIRRAFINAGAHALLTSLFEVPDLETRELMQGFYQALLESENRRSALTIAQRRQIQQRKAEHQAAHPFFWASFVLFDAANQ